jgi:hypothetical protein
MAATDFAQLTGYAKSFTGLTPEREQTLLRLGEVIKPKLPAITDSFYATLGGISGVSQHLEGRVDALKQTHLRWLQQLFSGPFDESYTQAMHRVGDAHVKVNLPVEFMAGGMTLIADLLFAEIESIYSEDSQGRSAALGAVNAILGFSLLVMQQSFHGATLLDELEKFLKITGISKALFNNLAAAYR